ncbi:ATP-binding protein [Actinoplanes sp. CA-142083]|uniref:ATP-binding protein n=1 Tax=Actinoplanes sp. CA-142083 TaxID=3239903 RepID=UPI003D89ECDB
MIARSAGVPIALIHLTDDGEMLNLAGAAGLPAEWTRYGPTPVNLTIAGLVLAHQRPIVISDITKDPRVPEGAPALELGVRAYAGFPIRDPGERIVGVCTALDFVPREWSPEQLAAVDEAAQACTALVTEQQRADTHRRFLEAILQHLHVGVAACDEHGLLVFANDAIQQLAGAMPPGDHISECAERHHLVDGEGRPLPAQESPLCCAMRGEELREAEFTVKPPGLSARTAIADAQLITGADGRQLGAVVAVRDVTDQRRAEQFRDVDRAVCDALESAADIHDAGPKILAEVCAAFGWARAEIWVAEPEVDALVGAARFPENGSLDGADALTDAAWRTGTPVWTRDTTAPQATTSFAVPLPAGGKIVAVMSFFDVVVDDPADALISFLSGIGARIAEFLERHRADELTVALARSKDDYLALIGHEVRTPLTSIAAYIEMLRECDPATAADDLPATLEVLGRNSAALRQIIDQLLDLAALDGGHAGLAREPICLAGVVRAAAEAAQPLADAAGVGVTLHLDTETTITGDPVRIRQLADQLLGNAIKHTPDGGHVTAVLTRPDPGAIELTVTDTGLGFPEDERDRMFVPFHRTERSRRHGIAGNGLGLAISRAVVEGHHGTIRLIPTAEPGSRIVVRLPVTLATDD